MRHPYFAIPLPIAIGHRGSAGDTPENTLESFARGLAAGAAILESDVHLSRDGVPVLIHDDEVGRVTDGEGPVRDLAEAELRRLDAGFRFSPDGGRSHPFRGRGLRIPTLAEALAAFPGARFNLELKENLPGIVERALEVVREAGREARTLLTSADDALMARLRAHLARGPGPRGEARASEGAGAGVALGAAVGDVLDFVRSALDGTRPRPGPMALQIPAEFAGRPLATRELVAHAHAHGVQVHVWTVNERAEMLRLLDLGVDGIVSDFPALAAEVCAARARG
jgi:glycerophosphoryl diester phosphodiesterase